MFMITSENLAKIVEFVNKTKRIYVALNCDEKAKFGMGWGAGAALHGS